MNFVMTSIVKFFYLMAFPALLSPTIFSGTTDFFQSKDSLAPRTNIIVMAETHSASYTVSSSPGEEAEGGSNPTPIPFVYSPNIRFLTVVPSAIVFDVPDSHQVPLLAYLSLLSKSPPALS